MLNHYLPFAAFFPPSSNFQLNCFLLLCLLFKRLYDVSDVTARALSFGCDLARLVHRLVAIPTENGLNKTPITRIPHESTAQIQHSKSSLN